MFRVPICNETSQYTKLIRVDAQTLRYNMGKNLKINL